MPSLSQRMRALSSKLLAIKLGSGSLVLPKDVKRIHMRFAQYKKGGHMGPRKFWKHELVRLKYHNPAVSMTIDRSALDTDPATMSIHFASPSSSSSSSTPPSAESTERVETIEMKGRMSADILEDFVRVTNAHPVEATPAEQEELRALEEQKLRSARDSKMSKEVRERKAREDALLRQAVGDVQANAS